ncbi:MAG TPA: alkaline phosphatase family protein, partial [Bacteroidia bacterium]|nr:alkaline phosphatase family protein [Bacteroidia bacterium]
FAIPDHQVAHIYVNDPCLLDEVAKTVRQTAGVASVHRRGELPGLDHGRSGDLVAVSDERSWFTYYWWTDDRKAPDFARCVDIHRKPGYDPVELFVDPKIRLPKLAVAWRLLKKMLGFRMLMDLIPLDASLVKGSHGAIPASQDDHPVLIGEFSDLEDGATLPATEVFTHLLAFCRKPA